MKITSTFSIIMVTHNTREMVKMSTLRTLRHIAGQDARLVVVDNGSTDGAAVWLNMLAQRGDITLIQSDGNIGHAPGIQLALKHIQSPYIVTIDSDAFPLSDDWLNNLRARLQGPVKVAGIRHYRDYIHPCCLMIARATLEEHGLDFLNGRDEFGRFDVAERITRELKRKGFQISGLERTGARRKGSLAEPIYLGSEYEGLVYHQWYTTRAATTKRGHVDDVPDEAIARSLAEVFETYHQEPRCATVVMGVRAAPGIQRRLRNALAALAALNYQDLPRWQYRIVVVEQDEKPRHEAELAALADRYIFAYNPGPYNRGWAFNVGAMAARAGAGKFCFLDADVLAPPDFVSQGLAALQGRQRAVSPYTEIAYLDGAASERALRDHARAPGRPIAPEKYGGLVRSGPVGGAIWVEPDLYAEIGGHDERYEGWGAEDRDFWNRLSQVTSVQRLPVRLLHLEHERADRRERHRGQRAPGPPGAIGDLERYTRPARRRAARPAPVTPAEPGLREWERWHTWSPARIDRIVQSELDRAGRSSVRRQLADAVVELGDSLLDVGSGPGALWPHLERHRPRFTWTGADVTAAMIEGARRLFPHVPAMQADAADLPFPSQSYDVVLLRHVVEHLPDWLMQRALAEATRVARRAVVLAFHAPPVARGERITTSRRGFRVTRWTTADIAKPVIRAGWHVDQCLTLTDDEGERDEVWVLRPS